MKTKLPVTIAFLTGLFMAFAYFVERDNVAWVRILYEELNQNNIVLAVFVLFLGVGTLLIRHAKKIRDKNSDSIYSWVVIVSTLAVAYIGLFQTTGESIGANENFQWIFNNFQVPLSATMFSLLAFFVASAAYRAFRARNTEATLLLIAAAIVMIGRVPIGAVISDSLSLTGSFSLPAIAEWILDIPNTAAKRAITIGIGLGMTATAIKIIFGIERTYMGSGK
ncbi:hypothetical protein CL643_00970 [bacterium]|nr:hypothetical protein [bacterium]|tara:strand:+ start:2443 stop:3111 length:669 start_codon:yes stop_codon:yes gene_type:complete